MNTIDKIMTEYEKLLNKNYKYTLSNGVVIELYFAREHLPHLLGLQHLTDIPILNDYNRKRQSAINIYNALRKGLITDEDLHNSDHFDKIKERFENIIDMDNVCVKNVVYRFDKNVAGTRISADVLLLNFNKKLKLHLFIKQDNRNKKYIPVTFFDNPTTKYYDNQEILNVYKTEVVEMFKNKGQKTK